MGVLGKISRSSAAATLVALSLAIPAVAQTSRGLSNIRIDNFGQVNASYYRGAQPAPRDYPALATLGVKTVIDLQADGDASEPALVQHAGMKFFRIPMTTREPPTPAQLSQFLSLVNDPVNQPVYVHCAGGRHRTGVMTAAYRITDNGWTADRAFQEMKQYKFGADFLHPEFKRFVYAYRPQVQPAAPADVLVAAPPGAPAVLVAAPPGAPAAATVPAGN